MLDAIGKAVLRGVDVAVEQRWDNARERAASAKGDTVHERVAAVTKSISRELTSLGAAAGASAVAPGLGTTAAVSLVASEAGWFAVRVADLIMAIGAAYGHTHAAAEERRAWILSILAFEDDAVEQFAVLAAELGVARLVGRSELGNAMASMVGGDAVTVDAFRRVNASLASKVLTRYGSRRGAMTLGKLLPFGIGAIVGGGANWGMTRAVAKQCRTFFDQYHLFVTPPPPSIQ